MKSNFGQTLRKIRKSKNISITQLKDGCLSKSQISRFERGESEISCIRLINLLNKLNVTIDEFISIHNNNTLPHFPTLINNIRKLYSRNDVESLKILLNANSKYTTNSLENTMLKSLLYTLTPDISPNEEELLELTDYLFSVEIWGFYEIVLLGNCVRTLNYNTVFLLTKEMLKNYHFSVTNKTNKILVTQLSINCLISSIDNEIFSNCQFLIKKIENLLRDELNFYEETVFIYANGYYEHKLGLSTGKEKMEKSLKILELLPRTYKTIKAYRYLLFSSKHGKCTDTY
ncbi:helix-turn-helix domain-containing protein [Streptococcus pneumoniae]|uniref:helix-turn-helix domain-containing protein n=1 Tax=Streptococcus pneumoniae TaxID=1313 RepID=UPI0005E1D47E|nr:Rgg/GadR/MutR family transcriptional regulator [Streptococcus pneumoniae]CKI46383.1 regulatory protein [Streptococcus pneumoniae]CKI74856.1 regulatory protein [Streptococcus pneumoniae]CKI88862.1 regulatory protein [Streptococcus pneumoniae]CKI95349.1 regulatory protein [Streptococcus pneumoniae]CKJ00781.1 regulatory protein [Streptococcus pneumoniae]